MPLAFLNACVCNKNANKFAVFLIGGAIERAKSHSVGLSRLRLQLETLQIFVADFNFKSFITLLICTKGT